jgi:UDP-2-acetamido-2,6-beta-L-arabino-hexul-4-ose reductase
LDAFVTHCDVIVHLAAVNRHADEQELCRTNVDLVSRLIAALEKTAVHPYVIFASSTQETTDTLYGKSKVQGRQLFEGWARRSRASFTGLIIPNVFGPFCRPHYNSFIATFCYALTHNEQPQVIVDKEVPLVYVSSLCRYIISDIEAVRSGENPIIKEDAVPPDCVKKVSDVLNLLTGFQEQYGECGIIPDLPDNNVINLFNTFRSSLDMDRYFPYRLKKHTDVRGTFVETLKTGSGGQVSFSITKSSVTRGNHFHTRKIERFTVIKGRAKIQLRKIGTNDRVTFILDGDEPAHVDMPIWYTHAITNIGDEDLYTQFWINEWYNEADPDTYVEQI